MKRWLTKTIIVLCTLHVHVLAQKLGNFEKEVEENDNDQTEVVSKDADTEAGFSFQGELSVESVEAMIQVTGAIFYGTYELLFHIPGWSRAMTDFGYSDYPYATPYAGIYQSGNQKPWMLNAQIDYFYMNRNLSGIVVETIASPHPYFSVQMNYSRLQETVSGTTDELALLDLYVNYNRIKDEHLAFWWGIGIKGMWGDAAHTGPALNIGAEYFPVQPLSIGVHYNIAFIENATLDDLQLLIGIHVNRLKLTAGYQKYRAGDISFPGIIAGIGLYL